MLAFSQLPFVRGTTSSDVQLQNDKQEIARGSALEQIDGVHVRGERTGPCALKSKEPAVYTAEDAR
jgi:hypothetical protein